MASDSIEIAVKGGWKSSRVAIALLILTILHHAYGAAIYDTPWRLHVAFIAVPVAGVILMASESHAASWRKIAGILILIFPVLLIGLIEGGYNHLLKNIVYFTRGAAATRSLFPSSLYELPDNLVFEVTGVAQFFLAPFAAMEGVKLLVQTPSRGHSPQ